MSTVRPAVTSTGAGSTHKPGLLGGILDANAYATKKTIAQGMLDVALLTANASQLKYLLQVGTQHEFYHLMMTLISVSIILQIAVGVLFIAIGYLNVNELKDQRSANILNNTITLIVGGAMLVMGSYDINLTRDMGKADRVNNWTTVLVFIIVAINVIISAIGMAEWSNFPEWTPKNCERLERFNLKCIEIRTLNNSTVF